MAESSFRSFGSSSSTSLSLLSRVRAAEPAAWERLTRLYGPVVYRWARQAGLQPQDASDVMQDVFHSVTTNIGKFEHQFDGGGFRGWLWTISRNNIRDHYRSLKGTAQATGGTAGLDQIQQLPELPPATSTKSGSIEISNLRRRAMELVRGDFEERTWQAFWRSAVEGDTPADVASDLGISVWAVYKARSRVLSRLRQELDGLNDG
ncbi:MAG: sigma-70 family RNA polymerase sigma factor [Planctomycetales bacterium]|nr:sigma-70 family RNA polymerase sigma factor [Planctomycetales bacterium]